MLSKNQNIKLDKIIDKRLENLNDDIKGLIKREIDYTELNNDKYSEKINEFWRELITLKHENEGRIEELKEDNLKVNTIESEGFLRGIITTIDTFKYIFEDCEDLNLKNIYEDE